VVVGALGSFLGGTGAAQSGTAEAGTRDATEWPFAADSPWNTPVGDAQFGTVGDPRTVDLRTPATAINAAAWSFPVYRSTVDDPVVEVRTPAGTRPFRIPPDARPAAPEDGDRHLLVIDPTGQFVDECWIASKRSNGGWSCRYHVRNRLDGTGVGNGGTRAYGGSALAGLMRAQELRRAYIPHALALALPRSHLAHGPIWPATSEDEDAKYGGSLPMGTLVAIPRAVDLELLDLSSRGYAIARALQEYGAYVVDASENFTLYAEPSAEELLRSARRDLDRIRREVRVVVDQQNARAAPTAPPFAT
jgi:hypothetical protein